MSRRNRVRERNRLDAPRGEGNGAHYLEDDDERHEAREIRSGRDRNRETPEADEADGGGMLGLAQLGARHPVTAIAVGFGLGFGVGVLVTAALSRREERWWEHGRLHDSMNDVSSRIRRVPSMIAEHLPASWTGR